jgi:hypothetical protein
MGWLPGMRHNCKWFRKASSGADPLVRAGPPGPATSSIDQYQQQADVGVGRGPGGPPIVDPGGKTKNRDGGRFSAHLVEVYLGVFSQVYF